MKTRLFYAMAVMVFVLLALVGLWIKNAATTATSKDETAATESGESFKETLKKAEAGNAKAQYFLGRMYAEGQGVPEDYNEAVKWWTKAAEQGLAEAQFILGAMYTNGVTQDCNEAFKWYKKAAEQGNAKAQYFLGRMYAEGQGVPEDYKEAAKWWTKAAEQGLAKAQYFLGGMYATGQGVLQDYIEAYKWLNLAAAQGDKDAAEMREVLEEKMTPSQTAEAQRLSNDIQREIKDKLNGKTAEEIIVEGNREWKEKEREQTVNEIEEIKSKIAELEEKRTKTEQDREKLKRFKVLRSRFYYDENSFIKGPMIELTVKNDTTYPVSCVYFHRVLATPGRALPWTAGSFYYSISGGLEPGEEATWRFSERGNVPEDRNDIVLTVSVTRIDGADNKPIFDSEFSDEDKKELEELSSRIEELKKNLVKLQ